MGNRRTFRPSGLETLEDRVVLSQGGVLSAAAHAVPTLHNTPSRLGPVGTLGDSYTDEYRFYAPDRSQARNWVEMLHTVRGVSIGPFTVKNLGEPRNQGFSYNWARSDATSVDMINNQLPGLAAQAAKGQIRYASIFIGGNDFLHLLDAAAAGQIPPANIPAALQATTTTLVINYETAVNTLLAASPNVRIAVWTLPDISLIPLAHEAGLASPAAAALLQGVSQAETQFNTIVKSLGSNPRIAVVDLASVTAQAASNPTGTISVGGETISLLHPSNDYHSFFLADLIHAGTVAQGIIADTFVLSIDAKFGEQLFPVTATTRPPETAARTSTPSAKGATVGWSAVPPTRRRSTFAPGGIGGTPVTGMNTSRRSVNAVKPITSLRWMSCPPARSCAARIAVSRDWSPSVKRRAAPPATMTRCS